MPITTWNQTSTPTWSPEYQGFNTQILQGLMDRLANPAAGTEPLRINAIDATNRRFQGLPDRIASNLASRGYGKSGALGSGIKGVEFARQGALGDIESNFAKMLLDRQDQNYDLAMRLLGMNAGQTSSGEQKTKKSLFENIMSIAGMALPFATGGLTSLFSGGVSNQGMNPMSVYQSPPSLYAGATAPMKPPPGF